jgi:hypothetical protein
MMSMSHTVAEGRDLLLQAALLLGIDAPADHRLQFIGYGPPVNRWLFPYRYRKSRLLCDNAHIPKTGHKALSEALMCRRRPDKSVRQSHSGDSHIL